MISANADDPFLKTAVLHFCWFARATLTLKVFAESMTIKHQQLRSQKAW